MGGPDSPFAEADGGPRRTACLLVRTVAGVVSVAILASFLNGVAEPFDSIAHFRAHLGVVLVILAVVLFARRTFIAALVAGLIAVAALATTLPWLIMETGSANEPPEGEPRYTLLQMNLRFDAEPRPALRRIAAVQPDLLTLQEVTPRWRPILATLDETYPYQAVCDLENSIGDVVVMSRRPMIEGSLVCSPKEDVVAARFNLNGRNVTIASAHLRWPWPFSGWQQIQRIEPVLEDLPTPLIIGGDFNATPWSAAVATVAATSGTTPLSGIGPTFMLNILPTELAWWVGLPIDNVLVSPEVTVLSSERLTATGSDHLPVLLTFTLEP